MKQSIPVLGASFVGTGDLFAALLLVWLEKTDLKVMYRCADINM